VRHNSAVQTGYRLVRLRNGACSVHSLAEDETFHPGIGPAAEAEALYVRQLHLPERVRETSGEFVIWDVGLGAAANALTAIRLVRDGLAASPGWSSSFSVSPNKLKLELQHPASKVLRFVSFDHTVEPLEFALKNSAALGYLDGYENPLGELIQTGRVEFADGKLEVKWEFHLGDFPALLGSGTGILPVQRARQRKRLVVSSDRLPPESDRLEACPTLSPPHAIFYDAFSPAKNPAMWTVPLFAGLFRRLDPQRPCALATFTRSTMARAALLLGGFFVGVGHPSGLKEETTVAANRSDLLDEPLDRCWLERAKSSHSAEPLGGPVYRQAPLSPETWERLRQHPQFR
jgi:hypothetical protein